MPVLLMFLDIQKRKGYCDLFGCISDTFSGSFHVLIPDRLYLINTDVQPHEIYKKLSKYLNPGEDIHVFTLNPDGPCKTSGDAISWLLERKKTEDWR